MYKSIFQIITLIFALLIPAIDSTAQNSNMPNFDSLRNVLKRQSRDSIHIFTLLNLSNSYTYHIPDSALYYAKRALTLSEEIDYKRGIALSCWNIATNLSQLGNYPNALRYGYKSLGVFKDLKNLGGEIIVTEQIGTIYRDQGDLEQALNYLMKARRMTLALKPGTDIKMYWGSTRELTLFFQNAEIAFSYINSKPDSSLYYINQILPNTEEWIAWPYRLYVKGKAFQKLNQFDSAIHYYQNGLKGKYSSSAIDLADIHIGLAEIFSKKDLRDSCLLHAKEALHLAQSASLVRGIYEASGILARELSQVNPKQSIIYYQLNKVTGDTLYNQQKVRASQYLTFSQELGEREAQQRLNQVNLGYKNRIKLVALSASILVLLIIAVGLWRRNIFKQKSLARLQIQKQEIDNQKTIVEKTLEELKSTQSQLIQSEKMASLGELTAGIAHEIQNPLNFVNNFSEVNKELLAEMDEGIEKGNFAEVKDIVKNIISNEEKISHHGKRADAIVRGMLQHSRSSSGVKEPTDINALCDEYLRLSYHGLRAKDNTFNTTLNTDYDKTIGTLNIIPQDIGRVILNLINNAFYAVKEKKAQLENGYIPTISVSTKKSGDNVLISVKDNGNGIPQNILDKIFQPFFTTKPTGQGTGLGLSLTYDILKAHGGEIRVKTKSGEGAEFIINLPYRYL
ncbi:MAG TPA: ATP-binding protein [Chryseolinea sp.]|nr:ATP-binding protein [Chryseolinea sp.]